ncbi:proteophosphoglycan 5 [Rhodotorula toruloides]|uniref:Proteophosphoglycan 5 n=1 Tax=Rhodotorula toruloides TaxID=5286 RepID=A0A511KEE5_RHOTO|nr:proteophosphoglycan 5 [Rhodotorula toruloides]
MPDTAGKKRAASEDFDSTTAVARPAPALRSGPLSELATGRSPAHEAVDKAEGWIKQLESKLEADEDVVLQAEDARGLVDDLRSFVAGFRSAPATRGDIADVLQRLDQLHHDLLPTELLRYSLPRHGALSFRLPSFSHRPSSPHAPSTFQQLPFDVVRLIIGELRTIHAADAGKQGLREWHVEDWQRTLCHLGRVSANMKEVCEALCKAELAVTAVEDLPRIVARMTRTPQYVEDLHHMVFFLRDLDQLGNRSGTDAAFSLPDVIRLGTNVTTISLIENSGYPDFTESLRFYLSRRGYSFDETTGGVSVPDTIIALPHLRRLTYGAPCSVDDIVKFVTQIPSLTSLDICGLVNHMVNPETRPASASIRRLWMPGVAVPPAILGALLGVPRPAGERQVNDDDESPRPHLRSLAFTFDPENTDANTGPNEQAEIDELLHLFSVIGPDLFELHLALPSADDNGTLSFLGPLFGAGGAGVGAGAFAALLPLPLPGAAVPQPGPAGAAAGPVAAVPQGAGAGARQWNAGLRGGLARRSRPLARGGGPQPPVRGHQAAAAAAQASRVPAGFGGGAGAAAPQPQGGPPPAPPGGPGGLANFNQLFAIHTPRPEHFFFAELLQHCPNLEHLELYGRRYSAGLFDVLRTLPLRHLALLELSGRGGDWAPSERRQVKLAAEKRLKLEYRSTDLKR